LQSNRYDNIYMVHLLAGSAIDPAKYPFSYRWDTAVRKHFERYQQLIDAASYRLQRTQRGWLVSHNLLSPSPIPNSTVPNCWLCRYCAGSRKSAKSSRTKSISTGTSTQPSRLILTEPSDSLSFFRRLASQLELAS